MDLDERALPDPVEPADALFEQFGVGGQIKEHQVMRKLEVAALAADLRADEDPGAVGFREIGGVPVPLHEGEVLVEKAARDVDDPLQRFGDALRQGAALADEQRLLVAELLEQLRQPLDPGLEFVAGFFEFAEHGFALRKPRQRGAGVAEHDTADPKGVEQLGDEAGPGRLGAGLQLFAELADPGGLSPEKGAVGRRQRVAGEQAIHGFCDPFVVLGFLEEPVEARVAFRIEQAQPGEMAFRAELLGGGGEQEQPGGFGGQGFHDAVGDPGLIGVPLEMVGFVDNEQVPAGFQGLGGAGRIFAQERQAAEHQLTVEERVDARFVEFDGLAAVLVEDAKEQVEPAPQFNKPLVDEWLGQEDQDSAGPACAMEPVQDQARLNRFTQTDFVGQKNPGHEPVGDFAGDENLVRDEVHAAPHVAAHRRLAKGAPLLKGLDAELKEMALVDLATQQPVLRGAETDGVGELRLGHFAPGAVVDEQPLAVFHGIHHELVAAVEFDPVALLELHPAQRRRLQGVLAVFIGGGEEDFHPAKLCLEQDAQPEFGFGIAHQTLSWNCRADLHEKSATLAGRLLFRQRVCSAAEDAGVRGEG